MTISILSALWVYTAILSPFFILVFYPWLGRWPRLFTPKVFVPAVAWVSVFWFLFFPEGVFYSHFLIAGGLLIGGYLVLLRSGYSQVQSAVLGVLSILAADQLWQLPYDAYNWATPAGMAVGLATQGFDLMSIPILGYFLVKFGGHFKASPWAQTALGVSAILTLWVTFGAIGWAYGLMFAWFGALIMLGVNNHKAVIGKQG